LLVAPDAVVGIEADVAVLIVGQLLQRRVLEALRHERGARRAAGEIEHGITIEAVTRRTLGIRRRTRRSRCGHAAEDDRERQQPVAASSHGLAASLYLLTGRHPKPISPSLRTKKKGGTTQ